MAHPGTVATPLTGWAKNDWGVEVFANHDQNRANANMTYHGVSIGAGLDNSGGLAGGTSAPIGRVTSWNPQVFARGAQHTYELSARTYGRPVDITPATNTGYTCSMTRIEVWQQEAEVVFGLTDSDSVFEDLMDQDRPFRVDEVLLRGTALYRHWGYLGCWFTGLNGGEYSAEGSDLRVTRSGEFQFVRRARLV